MNYFSLAQTAIEPGDIVFVISPYKKNLLIKIKEAVQSLYTSKNHKGHPEVISVAVCTGKNAYGVQLYNHERQIKISSKRLRRILLEQKEDSELYALLNKFCDCESKIITEALSSFNYQTKDLSSLTQQQIYQTLLEDLNNGLICANITQPTANWLKKFGIWLRRLLHLEIPKTYSAQKQTLVELLLQLREKSGRSQVLANVGNSFVVYKHNRKEQRENFINAYKEQIAITNEYYKKHKTRMSFFKIFLALFGSAKQDAYDKNKHKPAADTFCSRNVIEVLNQVDPNLVKQGRHSLPATLEAGFYRASIFPDENTLITKEDGSIDWEAQEKAAPAFQRLLIPALENNLLPELIIKISDELKRMAKQNLNSESLNKQAKIKETLAPFIAMIKHQKLDSCSQLEFALDLLAKLWPILQINTGYFNTTPTSFKNISAFARSQGLFEEDILAKVSSNQPSTLPFSSYSKATSLLCSPPPRNTSSSPYIFCDWSFNSWDNNKTQAFLAYAKEKLVQGERFYCLQRDKFNPLTLENIDAWFDFPQRFQLAEDLIPMENKEILARFHSDNVHLLDFETIQTTIFANDIEETLTKSASFHAESLNHVNVLEKTKEIIDIALTNSKQNPIKEQLTNLKKLYVNIEPSNTGYTSGVDTYNLEDSETPQSVFTPLKPTKKPCKATYDRLEVFSFLEVNQNKDNKDPFNMFTLKAPNITAENSSIASFSFSPQGFSNILLDKLSKSKINNYIRASITLNLKNTWQALPSSFAEDTLAYVAISGLNKDDFEIRKSNATMQYYIRSKTSTDKKVQIDYILKTFAGTYQNPAANIYSLRRSNPAIYALLLKYAAFKAEEPCSESLNAQEYLDAARKNKTGSCRLRAIAFKEEMQQLFKDIPVNVVANPFHCYVEIKLDGKWQSYCLGGTNAVFQQKLATTFLTSASLNAI